MSEQTTKRQGPVLWLGRRTWRFWIAASILLPLLYLASFGPVCWIMSRAKIIPGPRPSFLKPGEKTPLIGIYRPGPFIYKPLFYLAGYNRGPLGSALRSYVMYGMPPRDIVPNIRDDGVWWTRLDPSQLSPPMSSRPVNPADETPDAP